MKRKPLPMHCQESWLALSSTKGKNGMQESAGILLTEQQRPPLFGLPSHGMEAAGLWSATLALARSRRQFSWESEAFISLGQSRRLTGSIHSRHSSDVALQIEEAGLLQLQPMKMSTWLLLAGRIAASTRSLERAALRLKEAPPKSEDSTTKARSFSSM